MPDFLHANLITCSDDLSQRLAMTFLMLRKPCKSGTKACYVSDSLASLLPLEPRLYARINAQLLFCTRFVALPERSKTSRRMYRYPCLQRLCMASVAYQQRVNRRQQKRSVERQQNFYHDVCEGSMKLYGFCTPQYLYCTTQVFLYWAAHQVTCASFHRHGTLFTNNLTLPCLGSSWCLQCM